VNEHAEQLNVETELVVDDAIDTVALIHSLPLDSLAARDVHAAITVARLARSRLSRLVADARQEDVTWRQIGRILGVGRLWAILRYGPLVRRRRTPLTLD
jgi:hypothetical protein